MTDADCELTGDTVTRAIGRAWTDDSAWELLTALTELPNRMGGSPGERRAAELVSESFTDAGLDDPRIDEFDMQYWERGTSELTVETDSLSRQFETIALPYSPAGDVEGQLVDVGYGTPAEIDAVDLEGAIAVASTTTPADQRFVHRMEKYGHAVDAGAAAFVFVNHVSGQLPPTGSLRFNEEEEIPAVGVSAESGDWLSEYASRAEDVRAHLHVDARTSDGTSQNVHATIGPDTDDMVLVLAHYDAHDIGEGALDNGCGIATVAGAANILAEIEEVLESQVRIAGVGCEEIGLLGAEALADEIDPDSIRAVVNVDGAGRFRDLQVFSHASDELEELAASVAGGAGQPVVHEPDPHPFSDHWPFLQAGVPSVQLHSEPPKGSDRGRGWGHTSADTRDKVDPRNLREHAILAALLVWELTRTDVASIAVDNLRERLVEQDYEPGMRAAGIWPVGWE
ncbi:peptidase M28 [Natrialba chahannaoensis JCM 10990]|uniref:Carboxypeptidase Q n=1 Tax=Natrialba chahannaoensis JCM 10990 TaxID=1227492 RepID=M0AT09_9EURY|nr:M28 family metallopeptidase [Natrialba chahannaoensis]ELZ01467.1 peptidase M28 [Natrialba chahannaoensis JCM 10990]